MTRQAQPACRVPCVAVASIPNDQVPRASSDSSWGRLAPQPLWNRGSCPCGAACLHGQGLLTTTEALSGFIIQGPTARRPKQSVGSRKRGLLLKSTMGSSRGPIASGSVARGWASFHPASAALLSALLLSCASASTEPIEKLSGSLNSGGCLMQDMAPALGRSHTAQLRFYLLRLEQIESKVR